MVEHLAAKHPGFFFELVTKSEIDEEWMLDRINAALILNLLGPSGALIHFPFCLM